MPQATLIANATVVNRQAGARKHAYRGLYNRSLGPLLCVHLLWQCAATLTVRCQNFSLTPNGAPHRAPFFWDVGGSKTVFMCPRRYLRDLPWSFSDMLFYRSDGPTACTWNLSEKSTFLTTWQTQPKSSHMNQEAQGLQGGHVGAQGSVGSTTVDRCSCRLTSSCG